MRALALVLAAGQGVRLGREVPKGFVRLRGRTLLAWSAAALARAPEVAAVLGVLPADGSGGPDSLADGWAGPAELLPASTGGARRQDSVARGLEAGLRARPDLGWVLVHDAARCLVRPEWIERLIAACRDDAVGGLLALPVADTLKQATPEGRVAATRDRTGAWQAQTPQMFRLGLLRAALARAGPAITDEAGAMEAAGRAPLLVPGDLENFKLTRPGDFALAERLLATRP